MCENHISGQLRVAPEHISDKVLSRMGKPSRAVYDSFIKRYKRINDKTGKEQFVVPYLMSSHPGSTMKEAIELAEYVRDLGYMPEQVQDFIPHRQHFQHVCIIQVMTQEQWKRYIHLYPIMKKRCREHLSSTRSLRITIL